MFFEHNNEYRTIVHKFLTESMKEIARDCEINNRIESQTIKTVYRSVYHSLVQPYLCKKKQLDQTMLAVLHEEIGRISPAISGFFTVQSMVIAAIEQFGNVEQRNLLPSLYSGEILASFALSESNAGSNIRNIKTSLKPCADSYEVSGDKKWITMAQVADLYLVFGVKDREATAFLLENGTTGLVVEPISDIVGFRGGMYGELHLHNCKVASSAIIGGVGWGLSHVAGYALNMGRFLVACCCVGMAQASIDACRLYLATKRGNTRHQLIQRLLAQMITETQAARLMCMNAAYYRENKMEISVDPVLQSKYFASVTAVKAIKNAVQIHGADGLTDKYEVSRLYRDAAVIEIIEGTTQILEQLIGVGFTNLI